MEVNRMNAKLRAVAYAILAAVFYAFSTPVSKVLMEHVPATFMAAFLYLGAGAGVGVMYLFHYRKEDPQERLVRSDLPYVIAMIVLDIAAPIFMMLGIKWGTAANASLLGNFEIVATTLIALVIFKEDVSVRLWIAIALITVSGGILTFEGEGSFSVSYGSLFVLLATLCWGMENNCTGKISEKSTHQIVLLKGICSGTGAMVIALLTGESFPEFRYIAVAMLLGFVAYGLSIFTYIRAQRTLGAAKTGAYYAVAPFVGALFAFILVREKISAAYPVAFLIMLAGTAFVVWDTMIRLHSHTHTHTVTHSHDGKTHTHTYEHSHIHGHSDGSDEHTHHHVDRKLRVLHPHVV